MIPCNETCGGMVYVHETRYTTRRAYAKARIMKRWPCECTYRSNCERHGERKRYFEALEQRYLRILERYPWTGEVQL